MGLALKIKAKITPDTFKSGGSHGGETNMHPKNNRRGGSTSSASEDESATHNSTYNNVDKTQAFRGHRPRDSGIEIGHDSRFIEHVDVDPSNPEQAPTGNSGSHTKDPVSEHLPDRSRRLTAGAHTPGVDTAGGGGYSNAPAAGPSSPKRPTDGAGAFTCSKAGIKPDFLTPEKPGASNTFQNHGIPRPSLQQTRAYKSDAPLGIPKRSIVDGYGKDPSSPDSRLVMEKSSSPPGRIFEQHGHNHEAQHPKPRNTRVTPDTSANYPRDYAQDFEAGSHTPSSGATASANGGDEPGPRHELRRRSSLERATVPYAGELDKLEDTKACLQGGVGLGKHGAPVHSTLSGVKDSGIGRGGIHNGVIGNGASG